MKRSDQLPTDWQGLTSLFGLRPIRTGRQYDNAAAIMNRLAVLVKPTADQSDYLDTLSLLIEDYDRRNLEWVTAEMDPIGTLKFLMEEHGWTGSDLGRFLGSRSQGSLVLSGARELSKANMIALGEHFKVNPGLFLGPGKPKEKTKKKPSSRVALPRASV